jgi:hypothetical protein
MDPAVARSMAKWPNVPAVYGWLSLDRRGNWRIKGERIANAALRDFIARNYDVDAKGRWYFQNGPQRVYAALAYAPFVAHHEGDALYDQCGERVEPKQAYIDEEGSVLIAGGRSVALLDDRDLERYADSAERLPRIASAELERRFGFVREPRPA